MWPFCFWLKSRNAGAVLLKRPPLQASPNSSGLSVHGELKPPCTEVLERNQQKEKETTVVGILTVSWGVCVVITLALLLCQCPLPLLLPLLLLLLLSSLPDPARAVQCLVTGRPVWGCNNPAPTAHAPDSMLLKVHYK